MAMSDKQFKDLLAEHVTDDRAERALRQEREYWQTQHQLQKDLVDSRVDDLEHKLMEMKVMYE